MAHFQTPPQQPYDVFRPQGANNVKSRFIPNDYYVEFTPSWWRMAVDNAINYSDLTFLDALYSWCIESSPFLVSQINKRLIPMAKTNFAIFGPDGKIDEELTRTVTTTKWWKSLIRGWLLARFYGVQVVGVDVEKDRAYSYPIRNIDIVNEAVREITYGIESVALVKDYDNLFYMQPDTDQDFKLGMLQPISRAMIGIVEAYNNWSVTSASYSYPKTMVGYIDGNAKCKEIAMGIASNLDPLSIPVVPFKQNLDDKKNVYQVEVTPLQTQMYPDAFRVFKEYIDSYRSEIMQLVTGGTLLGATEKNTNSEQLAEIHMALYNDILENDKNGVCTFFNAGGAMAKLARMLGIPRLEFCTLGEVPDERISIDTFERIGRILASQGMAFSPNVLSKVGLSPEDVDTSVRNNNWEDTKLHNKGLMAKIKAMFSKKQDTDNGDDSEPQKKTGDAPQED